MSRLTFKESYAFICCECKHKMFARPSLMMTELGINSGNGRCTKCGLFLHLEIYPDIKGENMISKKFEDYLKEIDQKKEGIKKDDK